MGVDTVIVDISYSEKDKISLLSQEEDEYDDFNLVSRLNLVITDSNIKESENIIIYN